MIQPDAAMSSADFVCWFLGQLLRCALLAVLLVPFAMAAWVVVINAFDEEDIVRRQRTAEAPHIAATMTKIASIRPRLRQCDIDLQGNATCEFFTHMGERQVLRIAGDQP